MSDHLYYMSIKGGGSGDVHSYFNPSGNPIDAFVTFSNIISDFEARIVQELQKPELAAKWIMRRLPINKGFTFYNKFAKPTNSVASSIIEFSEELKIVPIHSIEYHIERGDFERWISHVLGDKKLAKKIDEIMREGITGKKLRKILVALVEARAKQLVEIGTKSEV